jgi:TH1 protein
MNFRLQHRTQRWHPVSYPYYGSFFTRPIVRDVALTFLIHTNSELTYQKINEIKEQALRVLLLLFVQGEVGSVLRGIVHVMEKATSNLDTSLIRYFVGGLVDVISPPCSTLMITVLGNLLLSPKCVEALHSTYFPEENKKRLCKLLTDIQLGLPQDSSSKLNSMIEFLLQTFYVSNV